MGGNGRHLKELIPEEWDPKYPIKLLPEEIRLLFVEEARSLYDDLSYNRQEIVLVPSRKRLVYETDKIRATLYTNPGWYSDLWWRYSYDPKQRRRQGGYQKHKTPKTPNYWRKPKSLIRRERVLRALSHIVNQTDNPSSDIPRRYYQRPFIFQEICRALIFKRLTEGYYVSYDTYVPPDNQVRKLFGMNPLEITVDVDEEEIYREGHDDIPF